MIDFSPSHPHDLRTMEDFYRPSLIGRGGPIAPKSGPGAEFELKTNMVRLLRQNCQFHGFRDEDANEHVNKFLSITQTMKQREVSQDSIRLNLFPFSLTHDAESWFYSLKTHSIHTWEEMFLKFLSKYFPYSRTVQLRKDIRNFQQLPKESVFEAWERFKSLLRKCPDHRISLLDQILTFYHGITSTDQDKIALAAGGNLMRKTPQEAFDLIENMTHHHYQWDTEVQYDSTSLMSDHDSEKITAMSARIEVKQESYMSQPYQQGQGHPHISYFSDYDESDEDEPFETKNHEIEKSLDTLSMGDKEVEVNPLKDIDDLVPIQRVSEKPSESISEKFITTFTNPLFDFNSEFTLISDNQIFDVESDESDMETDMDEVHIDSSQSTAQVPPPYILPDPKDILHNSESPHEEFSYELAHIDPIPSEDKDNDFDSKSDYTSSQGEFSDELSHIIALPKYDSDLEGDLDPGGGILYHKNLLDDDIIPTLPPEDFIANDHKSLNDDIQIKENVKFAFEDEG